MFLSAEAEPFSDGPLNRTGLFYFSKKAVLPFPGGTAFVVFLLVGGEGALLLFLLEQGKEKEDEADRHRDVKEAGDAGDHAIDSRREGAGSDAETLDLEDAANQHQNHRARQTDVVDDIESLKFPTRQNIAVL